MKITLLPGSLSFKYLAIVAMGERLCEILSTSLGNCLWIYDTKAGQQELVRKPFSASSCASLAGDHVRAQRGLHHVVEAQAL